MRAARVVVVCSQAWVARLVAGALEARALHVRVFSSPADALAAMRWPIDALVCDAAVPGGPSELVRALRAHAEGGHVPVLCLVPDEPSGGRLLALQAGVDLCLAQPFRVDELVAQVEALLALVARLHAPSLSRPPPAPRPGPPARPASLAPRAGPTHAPPPRPSWGPPAAQRVGPSATPPAAQRVGPSFAPPFAAGSLPPAPPRRDESLPPPAALEGDLAHVSLATVLSILEMERRSGVISVDDGARQAATLDLCFGSAVGGSLGGARVAPLAVLRQALAWPQGRFRFQPGPVADLRGAGARSLGALLIEAMRLADESAAENDPLAGFGEEAEAAGLSSVPPPRTPSRLEETLGAAHTPARTSRGSCPPASSNSSFPPPLSA